MDLVKQYAQNEIFSAIIIMFLPTIIDNVDKSGVLEEGIFRQGYFEVIKDNSSSTSGAVYILSLPYYLFFVSI